ncbi:MAG: DUF494 family protein [Oceanococcaceae bacterium]
MIQPNVLDALIYIFDVVLDDNPPTEVGSEHIEQALTDAGFPRALIDTAMDWLMDLAEGEALKADSHALRVYSAGECLRLSVDCRDRLLQLERQGILSAQNRERVIARLMALDCETIDADTAEWVTLMVLQADEESESEFNAMEGLVFDPAGSCLH